MLTVYRGQTLCRSVKTVANQPDVASSTTSASAEARLAGRLAQFLLGIPLGLFQLAAVLMFTFTGAVVTPGDWFVAVWGMVMSTSCALLALRIYRSASARRAAFVLLGVQGLFSCVKFFAYHESAGLVFAAIVAVTLMALVVYHRGVSA
jgi:hypothetical protein